MKVPPKTRPTSGQAAGQPRQQSPLSQVRSALETLLLGAKDVTPRRGRLLLERLESRQMMAGDVDLWATQGVDTDSSMSATSAWMSTTQPEGEAAQDLVGFARALADAGVLFYGAAWCPACTQQKELFQDGGDLLPFIEVTRSDRTLNAVGVAEGISVFPTWEFPDGTRAEGLQSLATLSQRSGVAIPVSDNPSFKTIGNKSVAIGSPLHIPIDAYDPGGGPITISVTVADPTLLSATVLQGNRSIRMKVAGYGDMVFELFEDRAPRPAGRVIELAESGFYDGILFHRIIDDFVLQAGDPLGNGTGGSTLPNFDDQFHPDLQHNRSGVLSFAKSSDDTNNSQFFITAGPTRTLDFNHSIFGQLVEGEKVRAAISQIGDLSDKGTNSADKPLIDIVIESMEVFTDNENSVVMLKALGNQTGSTTVTFTATDSNGNTFSEVITVTVVEDSGVGSNSQPYLNDIPAPAPAPNTSPVTLQLSHVDIEGDPVTYFANSATTGVSATIQPTTGLLTVTPSAGFVGQAIVNVGVQPAPGVVGALAGQSDTQRLVFTFTAGTTATAPSAVSLAAESDTGASNSDGITNAGSLTFNVTGVQNGAEVVLFAGTTEIGRGLASGTTATITTNNIAALGTGTYSITARQIVGTQTSPASPAITVVYDATLPDRVQNFPTVANVGVPVSVNLNHPEEGAGLTYSFTQAPTGATINAATGVISWTPVTSQIGTQTFTLALTDLAGNVRSEQFAVSVADEPLAGVRLEVTNLAGNVITSIGVGEEFLLRFYAQDLRSNNFGIFTAYTDIRFDSALAEAVATTPIQYGPGFRDDEFASGTFAPGVIDEIGSVANTLSATGVEEALVATVRMRSKAAGNLTFVSDPADVSGNEFLLFDEDTAVPPQRITYGRVELTVGNRFTANNDNFSVLKDAAATLLNVLQNDTFASGITGTLTLATVGTPSAGGTATISGNQVSYRPAAGFTGTETFTYTVSDNTGQTQQATATVVVSSTASPPPTAVNDSFTVLEDSAQATFNVIANDSPAAAGNTITVTGVGSSSRGSVVSLAGNGTSINYRPAANFFGTETITYTLSDSGGGTATGTVTFTVTAVNDPPPADNITRDVFRGGGSQTVATLDDYGTNVDGPETLTVQLIGSSSAGGTFAVNGTTVTYTPANASFVGTDTIGYRTTDPGGLSSTGTITINVLDSLPTQYALNLLNSDSLARLTGGLNATLTGTTSTGQAVSRTLPLNGGASAPRFDQIAPGSYQINIPAIEFLIGMEQSQTIEFTALPAGGQLSSDVRIGSIHPKHIRMGDYFSNAPREALFAVVEPGRDALVSFGPTGTPSINSPIVTLNEAGTTLQVRGTNGSGVAVTGTLPAVNDARVQTRASNGTMRLVKVSLVSGDLTLTPVTAAASEAASAAAFAADPSFAGEGEGNDDPESPQTMIGVPPSDPLVANDSALAQWDQQPTSLTPEEGDGLANPSSAPPQADAVDQLLSTTL